VFFGLEKLREGGSRSEYGVQRSELTVYGVACVVLWSMLVCRVRARLEWWVDVNLMVARVWLCGGVQE
jgi:hypothetical protein